MEQIYIKHTVTQEDLDNNPNSGLVLGEEIGIPVCKKCQSDGVAE